MNATAKNPIVLHYTGSDWTGGGIHSTVRALHGAGMFRVVLGVAAGFPPVHPPHPKVWRGPAVACESIGLLNAWRTLRVAWRVRRWLRRGGGRTFHGHSRAGLLVTLWLRLLGERRVVASVHCYGRQRWFYRSAARLLGERLLWLSPAMRAYYGASGEGWEHCVPECVARTIATEKRERGGRLLLAGVGGVLRWKRWDLVLEALAALQDRLRAGIEFEHIGLGDAVYARELRERTRALGLEGTVRWRGQQPDSAELLARCDALVVASDNEPLSLAMLEALAAGRPVLAADSGGARDIIRPGVNGELFASGDATALAARLSRWLESPPVWDAAVIRETSLYADDVAVRWLAIYRRLE